MESVRIYEIAPCKMVASPCGMFGDGKLEAFDAWLSALPRPMFPKDFLWFGKERGGLVWYYIHSEGMEVPEDFSLVDFPGGLYAVATGVDGSSSDDVMAAIHAFLAEKGCFAEDASREPLGNVITPPAAQEAMGYNQMDYYVPIRVVAP